MLCLTNHECVILRKFIKCLYELVICVTWRIEGLYNEIHHACKHDYLGSFVFEHVECLHDNCNPYNIGQSEFVPDSISSCPYSNLHGFVFSGLSIK